MSIFSFLGFYYSLAQARITNALERDPKGTKRKYMLVQLLWISLLVVSGILGWNFVGVMLLFAGIASIPLAIPIASDRTDEIQKTSIHRHDERLERLRRKRILEKIDKREADERDPQ